MTKRMILLGTCFLVLATPMWAVADVTPYKTLMENGRLVDAHICGGKLANTTNYDWWYGCSPTSAGMMMGHYDRNGYAGNPYPNLVPGGVAEANTFGVPGALANKIIASSGHINDFYVAGYGASGDDLPPPWHDFDCLADFMGTSQDAAANNNGWTKFWYWNNGAPYTEADAGASGHTVDCGMYGIGEYLEYAGYDADVLYNQYIDAYGAEFGFTLAQFKAEIDAGRPVLVHVQGHTMFGYGYDDDIPNLIYVHDTWDDRDGGGPWTDGENPGWLTWGGLYPSSEGDLEHYGVTVLSIIPEPGTLVLLAIGLFAVRRRAA